ncbi:IMP dehydrogenase [Patescibacteria group bacterium]|nr:IMP dehydrogenase [Patescibacteria group bacterium]MBU1663689.1 IMP dehydrogenase [Patescibacteria group bacterium]MBU1934326.1 IMP dehydrogenase [Patescibacteria group bacterium]MBU2007738.1 IMP dehydrogenase [Patescibacteria group bacterium]MBU2233638.1 IMP dehydrogenase [Patescibacteria group bacterium]
MLKQDLVLKKDKFFEKIETLGLALSYGDVRLRTSHSEIAPSQVKLSSRFSRRVPLKAPLISAPMDMITEHKMAIALAVSGGLGIIHRALKPEDQVKEVSRVKFYLNGLIEKPICVSPKDTIAGVLKMIKEKNYSFRSFPVIDVKGKLLGLMSSNDIEFCPDNNYRAGRVMTKTKDAVTAKGAISFKQAYDIMRKNKKKILPLIDKQNKLVGMYVYSDVKRIVSGGSPWLNIDANGNLRVGAAIGVGEDAYERAGMLAERGVDVLVIDTAHGDSKAVLETLKQLKKDYPEIDIVAGNVSEAESAKRLVQAGADGVKVGQGPGSICTTRVVAGIGCPQVTAIYNCARALRGSGVSICADGGIEYSGDATVALAAGADSVMLGQMLAGTNEAPGEVFMRNDLPVKKYRGMGSLAAMQESQAAKERYGQKYSGQDKLVPEGVEAVVPYKGAAANIIFQTLGGLRSGLSYTGAADIKELQAKADFYYISSAGLSESHPHGIIMEKEAPNYLGRI